MSTIYNNNVTGMILAGGKARRMGGVDKGLIEINNQAMIQYVIDVLKPQTSEILINANRSIDEYEKFGCSVISDQLDDFQGPLAGIAACMGVAKNSYICTCPCDGPLIAEDLVTRLFTAMSTNESIEIAVAHDGDRMQPVYALLGCSLQNSLLDYLASGERKIDRWYAQHKLIEVDFSDQKECFININTPEDKLLITQQLANQASNS